MVTITNIDVFSNRFRTEKTGWLLGVVPEKITATINISVGWFGLASSDFPIIFSPLNSGILNEHQIIKCDAPVFTDFKKGDKINITSSGTNNRTGVFIIEKISDYILRIGITNDINNGETFVVLTGTTTNIIGVTPITAMNISYGLVENSEATNYLSKIDGSNQKFIAELIDAANITSTVPMIADGAKSWQNGSTTIKGNGIDTFFQKFIITHEFYLLPHYLGGQFDDIKMGTKPNYFNDLSALRYVAKIDAMYLATDPNNIQVGEINNVLGNTGWFNENFNNEPTKYSVSFLEHKKATGVIINSIELTTNENSFEIRIKNTTATPFSNGNTKVELGFSLCPEIDEYKNPIKTVIQNFALDKVFATVGGTIINGELFGSDEQVFKNVKATFISTSEIKITGKVALKQTLIDRIKGFVNQRYLIYVITQNHLLSTTLSDKASLLVEADDFFIDLSEDGLITFQNNFFPHNDPLLTGSASISSFPGDEVVLNSIMKMNLIGKNANIINGDTVDFKTLEIDIFAQKGSKSFIVEKFKYDFSNDIKAFGVTFVDFKQNRIFKLPTDDIRRLISIQRRFDLDTATIFAYQIKYPFLFRWEYWEQNLLVDGDFFLTTQPKNGKNNFWHRFNSLGWQIKISTKLKVSNAGFIQTYEGVKALPSYDYNSNSQWINETIKSFDLQPTPNQLISSGNNFVQGFEKTKIEAFFEKTVPFVPADISVLIWAEAKEAGGIAGRERISSLYDVSSDSMFESINATPRVKLTIVGQTVKAEAVINNTKIPAGIDSLEVYARLYEVMPPFTFFKIQTDNSFKLQTDNSKKLLS